MPLLRSPSAKSLSLVAIPAPVSIGQWSRLSHGYASWFGIAVAAVQPIALLGPREDPFPRFPLPPRKPPDSARSHTWRDSDTGLRRQVGNMPYLGVGSISGIIHIIARIPHAARAVVVVAVLIAIWR